MFRGVKGDLAADAHIQFAAILIKIPDIQPAGQPKALYIVPGAGHVDLYDRTDLIPFAKLTSFFKASLK